MHSGQRHGVGVEIGEAAGTYKPIEETCPDFPFIIKDGLSTDGAVNISWA
jgi:hypothetical protein